MIQNTLANTVNKAAYGKDMAIIRSHYKVTRGSGEGSSRGSLKNLGGTPKNIKAIRVPWEAQGYLMPVPLLYPSDVHALPAPMFVLSHVLLLSVPWLPLLSSILYDAIDVDVAPCSNPIHQKQLQSDYYQAHVVLG